MNFLFLELPESVQSKGSWEETKSIFTASNETSRPNIKFRRRTVLKGRWAHALND